jgi:hypothetical protein
VQFIDQAPAYSQKSISLTRAIDLGRAKINAEAGSENLMACFRPELKIATAFDTAVDARMRFFDLPTPDKLDLMINELLPGFYHPELLPLTGRDSWVVRFVVDGDVHRTLIMDADGIRTLEIGQDPVPAIELETDIMTLLALLRSTIADFHLNTPDVTASSITALSAEEASEITGGMPADPAGDGDEGDEGQREQ